MGHPFPVKGDSNTETVGVDGSPWLILSADYTLINEIDLRRLRQPY
jgi:hypothetical protein